PRDRCDGGQRLAAEPERRHADQVRGLANLARGMTRQRELRIGAAHARAVVADSNQALPTILDVDADRAGAGIECVLDQLLHHRPGPLDHLARGSPRRRTSRAARPAAATVTSESPRTTVRRRRAATAIHRATQQSPAPSAHSPGVARPVVRSASLAASGAGRSSRARRTKRSRGASRAALAQAAVALPSAPARYNVAPRLYQCAGTRGSPAARAANESAAARRAPASYSASALSV